ncbi:hypothetical protein [Sphingomonas oligophenolica]|uniref:Uncharacterized protein n=1 Tax=Sphingomonas oligophenolica TaxID=301154 RepID=A0A502CJZ8_9SPHN|nr:hypothetical protein [Sphingomonas oligophenolica]TPG13062.1 hypothetical protein EAH84_06500 [Sphingomonas oligophenolica]
MTKTKIPKRIAGVKLNKKLRKRGNELLELADSPHGRQTIAMGLSMAAAGLSVALKKRGETRATPADAPTSPTPPIKDAAIDGTPHPAPPLDPDKIVAAVSQTIDAAMAWFFPPSGKR